MSKTSSESCRLGILDENSNKFEKHFTTACMRGVEGKRFWRNWVGMVCLRPPAEACWANPRLLLCFVFVPLLTYQQYVPLLLVLVANVYSIVFCVGATLSLMPQKWGTEPVCIPNSFWEVLAGTPVGSLDLEGVLIPSTGARLSGNRHTSDLFSAGPQAQSVW